MKRVLITGATAGIGRACARVFAGVGWAVTAVARSAADLASLATELGATETRTVAADLATARGRAAVPDDAYTAVVLNAAVFMPGGLVGGDQDVFAASWELNVLANYVLARALVPGMVARGEGRLIVVGSTGTDDWPAGMEAYVATKYALRGLYEGWRRELAGSGVTVTLVAPGATRTRSWAGQETPVGILEPAAVAAAVLAAARGAVSGRVVLPAGGGK